jgi:hypothetical protein
MSHEQHKHNEPQRKANKPWHQDWKTWTAIVLMLAAMLVYVFSVDESVGPGADETGVQTPAAE